MTTNTLHGFKTTFYLSQENKNLLQELEKGEKTKAINEAISEFFTKKKREREMKKFYNIMEDIKAQRKRPSKPVVETIREMREERTEQIIKAIKS